MSWMHDRAFAPRSRQRSLQQTAALNPFSGTTGAAPEGPAESETDHVGIPHIITRRARWMTSRLRQR